MTTSAMAQVQSLRATELAVFLDFDGTLIEFAERPDLVRTGAETIECIAGISAALGGALAIVSGREITDIDRQLAPLVLPAAGVHGLELRDARGKLHKQRIDDQTLRVIKERLLPFAERHAGLLLEEKTGSIALHYRARPDLETACRHAMQASLVRNQRAKVLRGSMVFEVMAHGADKGTALAMFMMQAPFKGRLPVYAGDDTTDEDAFREVNSRGGISIKVGPGETDAQHRIESVSQMREFLRCLARHVEQNNDGEMD